MSTEADGTQLSALQRFVNDEAQLISLARELAQREGARRTAGRLFNLGALLLAETGLSERELYGRLQLAFLNFHIDELDEARH